MTKRNIFGVFCLFAALISLTLLMISQSYLYQLGLFFVVCLAVFHAGLAFWTKISRRWARSTDYIYFLFAIVSILLASFSQSHDRRQQFAGFLGSVVPEGDTEYVSILDELQKTCASKEDISLSEPIFLDYSIEFVFTPDAETCHRISEIRSVVAGHQYDRIPALLSGVPSDAPPFFDPFFANLPLVFSGNEYLKRVFLQMVQGDLMQFYLVNVVSKQPNHEGQAVRLETSEIFFKYLLSSIWPFVLAFAIALRMTRVTADVTEWPV